MSERGPKNYGYIRGSTVKQEATPEVQRGLIADAAARLGVTIDTWVEDPATTSKLRLDRREGGKELFRMLRKGDTVWFAKMDRGFRSLADFAVTLDKWERLGVGVRICNILGQFDISTPDGKAFLQMIAVFAEWERKMTSIRTREALALAKRKGQANGKYAGYGFRWEKRPDPASGKYKKCRVPDHDERSIMGQIVAWYVGGTTFEGIHAHLRKHKVKTPEGREWSLDRVKRAYAAELVLRQSEAPRAKT